MTGKNACLAAPAAALLALPLTAGSTMTAGLYEYTVRMNVPGAPANMPAQTMQRCLTAKDAAGDQALEMPRDPGSDCRMRDLAVNGSQFTYKVVCTKPQKIDGAVKGTTATNSITMDMTMTMEGIPGPITQSMTARRIGDCKQ